MRTNPVPYVAAAVLIGIGVFALKAHDEGRPRAHAPPVDSAALQNRLFAPIAPRVLHVGANELLILEVPSQVNPRIDLVETQRCFIWRDTEFKTSTVACPQPPELQLPPQGPEPDMERR